MDERFLRNSCGSSWSWTRKKTILRQTHLTGYKRQEDDAEHAWHMAVMACLLKEYANEPFDLAKTLLMILLHDVVEIDAGDTYAYDAEAVKSQRQREEKGGGPDFRPAARGPGQGIPGPF